MNKEKELKAIEIYKSGKSLKQTGEIIGETKESVRWVMKKHGVDTKRTLADYDNRKYSLNDFYFSKIDTEFKAYMVGFIMADGYVSQDKNTLTICIHKKDVVLLQRFLQDIESDSHVFKHNKDYVRIVLCSRQIVSDLVSLGIVQCKTKVLKCPNIETELMRHLIRGYFDGDGSIWYDKNSSSYRVQFIGTKDVMETFQIFFNNYNKLRKTSSENIIFRYGFSGNVKTTKYLSLLYDGATIYLERKYEKFKDCKKLKEYNEEHKEQIWISNLGSYIRKNIE